MCVVKIYEAEMEQIQEEGETKRTKLRGAFCTVARKILSSILTLAALGLIVYAIGNGYAALPGHWAVQYTLLMFVIVLLGYLEGLQIAILEMEHSRLPPDESFQKKYQRGIATLELSTANSGVNVKRFLIGRQFFVVFVVFLCAQLTTFPTLPKTGWPQWLFVGVIDTGLPGALVVLAFGQLMPQLIAASHPLRFLNLRFSWSVVKLALTLESIGIAHFSWVLSSAVKWYFGWRKEEEVHSSNTNNPVEEEEDAEEADESDYLIFRHRDSLSVSSEEAVNVAAFEAAKLGCEEVSDSPTTSGDAADVAVVLPPWITQQGEARSKYKDWGYNPLSGAPFPGPEQIVDYLVSKKKRVPRYLLPPSHSKHIPPHVVAYDLLKREGNLDQKCLHLEMNVQELQKSLDVVQSKAGGDIIINGIV